MLVTNIIAIINIAVIFLLLSRFSQKYTFCTLYYGL